MKSSVCVLVCALLACLQSTDVRAERERDESAVCECVCVCAVYAQDKGKTVCRLNCERWNESEKVTYPVRVHQLHFQHNKCKWILLSRSLAHEAA